MTRGVSGTLGPAGLTQFQLAVVVLRLVGCKTGDIALYLDAPLFSVSDATRRVMAKYRATGCEVNNIIDLEPLIYRDFGSNFDRVPPEKGIAA